MQEAKQQNKQNQSTITQNKRVLVKFSGEALAGESGFGIEPSKRTCRRG